MIHTHYRLKRKISLRIALVADPHNITCETVLLDIRTKQPNIIIIAGDIIYGAKLDRTGFVYNPSTPMLTRFPNADKLIKTLPTIAPTFFSYGNHEWLLNKADVERIRTAGIVILHNTFIHHNDLVIGGLSSPDVTNYWFFQNEWRAGHPDDMRGNLRRSYYYWKTHEERKTVESSWLPDFESQ